MQIKFSSAVLIVDDYEKMVGFYRDVLLQECEVDFGNCMGFTCGLSIWKMGEGLPLAQELGRTHNPDGNKNLEICFESEDFDQVLEHLGKEGLDYIHTCIEEPWGQRTLRFYDPEKNMVEVGESVPSFVRRFRDQGLSPEEVSKRCHVPLPMVEEICKEG